MKILTDPDVNGIRPSLDRTPSHWTGCEYIPGPLSTDKPQFTAWRGVAIGVLFTAVLVGALWAVKL